MRTKQIVGRPGIVPIIVELYARRKEVVYPTDLSCHISNYTRLKEVLNELKNMGIVHIEREDENPKNWHVSLTLLGKKIARVLINMDKSIDTLLSAYEADILDTQESISPEP